MYIDVSMNIEDGMLHWPKDPEITIKQFSNIKNGDSANNSRISFGTHTGTHVDAPRHFVENGIGIDRVDLNTLIGVCRVIEISYDYKSITEKLLSGLDIKKGERILFKSANSSFLTAGKVFREDYVYVDKAAAKYLADKGVILVGVDYLSVEGYGKGHETHKILLGAGIPIIEGLNLKNVNQGEYKLIALPIKIKGADGAPARVLLETNQEY